MVLRAFHSGRKGIERMRAKTVKGIDSERETAEFGTTQIWSSLYLFNLSNLGAPTGSTQAPTGVVLCVIKALKLRSCKEASCGCSSKRHKTG